MIQGWHWGRKAVAFSWLLVAAFLCDRGSHAATNATVTSTKTRSLSLRTESQSVTSSLSDSLTESQSLTGSVSDSLTESQTLRASNNYTTGMVPLDFEEGQEFRIRLTAVLSDFEASVEQPTFNLSDPDAVTVRLLPHYPAAGRDCESSLYTRDAPVLLETKAFGASPFERAAGDLYAFSAYATLAAPSHAAPFVICYRVSPPEPVVTPYRGRWAGFSLPGGGQYVFSARPTSLRYHLPDATERQFAVIELQSDEAWNLTYPPSSCVANPEHCLIADNLKLVPKDAPCTHERRQPGGAYFGSTLALESGAWAGDASYGLVEGGTVGGVGVFGTQWSNPLVDSWTDGGVYEQLNATAAVGGAAGAKRAYVYVQLPAGPENVRNASFSPRRNSFFGADFSWGGDFDVCFSSRERRALLVALAPPNATSEFPDGFPLWQKLFPTRNSAGNGTKSSFFGVARERISWTAADLSPRSWGPLIFSDPAGGLSSARPAEARPTSSYWRRRGGDVYKLVPSDQFVPAARPGSAPAGAAPAGSMSPVGCWSTVLRYPRAGDSIGGSDSDAPAYPTRSDRVLDAASLRPSANASNATVTMAYIPPDGVWYVCYRQSCETSDCTPHAGYRVLRYQPPSFFGITPPPPEATARSEPERAELNGTASEREPVDYFAALRAMRRAEGEFALVPRDPLEVVEEWAQGDGEERRLHPGAPPPVTWYANDTRSETWGPVVVEVTNTSTTLRVDTHPWRMWGVSAGSRLRLVPWNRPCDHLYLSVAVSESQDAGTIECDSSGSTDVNDPHCQGSRSNAREAVSGAYYIYMPGTVGDYRVCFQHASWNWRELQPTFQQPWLDPLHAEPDARLKRQDWDPAIQWLTVTESPKAHFNVTFAARTEGLQAIVLVEDAWSELTVAPRMLCPGGCQESGDVLRLVRSREKCDVNPTSWNRNMASTELALYCRVPAGTDELSSSGLFGRTPCGETKFVSNLCEGTSPCTKRSTTARLQRYLETTWPPFNHIAPMTYETFLQGAPGVAGAVMLPTYNETHREENVLKVCYKQAKYQNWIEFPPSSPILPARPQWTVNPPFAAQLLSGFYQSFNVTWTLLTRQQLAVIDWNQTSVFAAKLVRALTGDAANSVTTKQTCLLPAAGSQASQYASYTHTAWFDLEKLQLRFFLNVPQDTGSYALCVRVGDTNAWLTTGSAAEHYRVVDNGVRWFVEPGNLPRNNAVLTLHFQRCSPGRDGYCGSGGEASAALFNTSAGADAAKLVAASDPCVSTSPHIGIFHTKAGCVDLGPENSIRNRATCVVSLPATEGDQSAVYKVCMRTSFVAPGSSEAPVHLWVEVREGVGLPSQTLVVDEATREISFTTRPSGVHCWSVTPEIRPLTLRAGPVNATNRAVLAGASTLFVRESNTASPPEAWGHGFWLEAGRDTAVAEGYWQGCLFKLVHKRRYLANTDSWSTLGTTCLNPPTEGAGNTAGLCDPNTGGLCANISEDSGNMSRANVIAQIPLEPGDYWVCFRLPSADHAETEPWQALPNGDGVYDVFVHPTNLGMDVTAEDTVVVIDTNVNGLVSLSSWCSSTTGQGLDCADLNDHGYRYDLLTIANGTDVCPTPTQPPLGGSAQAWLPLQRHTNVSAVIASGVFALPPISKSASGRYKLCLYKAGQPAQPDGHVAKRGVVYQLTNYDLSSAGGGTGYWIDANTAGTKIAQLVVASSLVYNESRYFTEYVRGVTDVIYGSSFVDFADQGSEQASASPLIEAGTIIEYTVQAVSADGAPVPLGSFVVSALRCEGGSEVEDAACTHVFAASSASSDSFQLEARDGECGAEAPNFNWPASGLTQLAREGRVAFKLAYLSSCTGVIGCGVRFVVERGGEGSVGASGFVGTDAVRVSSGVGVAASSLPQWVNVRLTEVQSVGFDEVPASAGEETLRVHCTDRLPCELTLFAFRNSVRQRAPSGMVSMMLSQVVYGSVRRFQTALLRPYLVTSVKEFAHEPWSSGGIARFPFEFRLVPAVHSFTAHYNLTFGSAGRWVHVAVSIEKPVLQSVAIDSIIPEDLGLLGSRPPAPSFSSFVTVDGQEVPAGAGEDRGFPAHRLVHAANGSYLEALVPYALYFRANAVGALGTVPVEASLEAYRVSGAVDGEDGANTTKNAVLGVLLGTDGGIDRENLYTTRESATRVLFETPTAALPRRGWGLRFRVLNSFGCSRFRAAGGCLVSFTFAHVSAEHPNVTFSLRTPVRVVGSVVKVEPAVASPQPIRLGIPVTAVVGTPCGAACFMVDEFHTGDIFALMGPGGGADGTATAAGVSLLPPPRGSNVSCAFTTASGCSVYAYPLGLLAPSRVWGASFVLQTTAPCEECELSFHSTLGAGPSSFESPPVGIERVTLVDEAMALSCSQETPLVTVTHPVSAAASDRFAVQVSAVTAAGIPLRHPAWAVTLNATTGLIVNVSGPAVTLQGGDVTVRMAGGAAVLPGLFVTVADGAERVAGEQAAAFYLRVRAGESPELTCDVGVRVVWTAPQKATVVRATLTGATPLCGVEGVCAEWAASVADLKAGLPVVLVATDVDLASGDSHPATDVTGITLLPLGGPLSEPTDPVWSESDAGKTASVTLDSSYHAEGETRQRKDGYVYTHGTLSLRLTRPRGTTDQIVLAYSSSADVSPVRHAVFKVCIAARGTLVLDEPICTAVHLWIEPDAPAPLAVLVWSASPGGAKYVGQSAACGNQPSLMSLQLLTYTEVPGAPARTRFLSFGVSLHYLVTFGGPGQILVLDRSAHTNETLVVPNGVSSSDGLRSTADGFTEVAFYVQNTAGNASAEYPFRVRAASLGRSDVALIEGTATAETYHFTMPTEQFASFTISDRVYIDDDCLSKRVLETADDHYKTYTAKPAAGWSFYEEAVAGLPFPVEAVVRTEDGRRAWTHPPTHVRVSKHSSGGCGDGGALAVHTLLPPLPNETLALRRGELLASFAPGAGGGRLAAVAGGAAVVWPVFSRPCAACVLQLDLCYGSRADPEDCLRVQPSDAATPLHARRSLLTKPFSVRRAVPNALVVERQVLPTSHDATGVISVGDPILLGLAVRWVTRRGWSFAFDTAMDADVVVSVEVWTVYTPPPHGAPGGGRTPAYGNGGFLTAAADAGPCGVSEPAFAAASPRVSAEWVVPAGQALAAHELGVSFARPCASCALWVAYSIGGAAERSFAVRGYPSSPVAGGALAPVRFAVKTCGVRWIAIAAPRAVRRGAVFSVAALRVDRHGVASFDYEGSVDLKLDVGKNEGAAAGGSPGLASPAAAAAGNERVSAQKVGAGRDTEHAAVQSYGSLSFESFDGGPETAENEGAAAGGSPGLASSAAAAAGNERVSAQKAGAGRDTEHAAVRSLSLESFDGGSETAENERERVSVPKVAVGGVPGVGGDTEPHATVQSDGSLSFESFDGWSETAETEHVSPKVAVGGVPGAAGYTEHAAVQSYGSLSFESFDGGSDTAKNERVSAPKPKVAVRGAPGQLAALDSALADDGGRSTAEYTPTQSHGPQPLSSFDTSPATETAQVVAPKIAVQGVPGQLAALDSALADGGGRSTAEYTPTQSHGPRPLSRADTSPATETAQVVAPKIVVQGVRGQLALDSALADGGGGSTAEYASAPTHRIRAARGVALARIRYSRGCYRCTFTVGGAEVALAVLADARQLLLVPVAPAASRLAKTFSAPGTAVTWAFALSAADEWGDRSYFEGLGPSYAAMAPNYAGSGGGSDALVLRAADPAVYQVATNGQTLSLFEGNATVTLLRTPVMVDGVPVACSTEENAGAAQPGIVTLQLSGYPSANVRLTLSARSRVDAGTSLPLNYHATGAPPILDYTPTPSVLYVDDPESSGCQSPVAEGLPCGFRAFLGAPVAGRAGGGVAHFVSAFPGHSASAAVTCDGCAAAVAPGVAAFERGVASFRFVASGLTGNACVCTVVVKAPGVGGEEVFVVRVERTLVTDWLWGVSQTLSPRLTDDARGHWADSVGDRLVVLRLVASDASWRITGLGGLDWGGATTTTIALNAAAMLPAGCFACSDLELHATDPKCVVSVVASDIVLIHGVFTTSSPTCVLTPSSIPSLPQTIGEPRTMSTTLTVTLQTPSHLVLLTPRAPFANLTATLPSSVTPAAAVGVPCVLRFEVVDSQTNRVTGDNFMTVELRVSRRSVPAAAAAVNASEDDEVMTLEEAAEDGVVSFVLAFDEATDAGQAAHNPWVFSASAAADAAAAGDSFGFAAPDLAGVELFVVDVPVAVAVRAVGAGGGLRHAWAGDDAPFWWIRGFAFGVEVTAVNALGRRVRSSTAELLLQPVALQCLAVDESLATTRCPTPGYLRKPLHLSELPSCNVTGWLFSGATRSVIPVHLVDGWALVPSISLTAPPGLHKFSITAKTADAGPALSFTGAVQLQGITSVNVDGAACSWHLGRWRCPPPPHMANHSVADPVEFAVFLADDEGRPVAADNASTVLLTSRCGSGEASLAGVGTAGDLDLLAVMTFPVVQGVALVHGPMFSGPCASMTLTATCVSGAADTLRLCEGKRMTTLPFSVIGNGVAAQPSSPVRLAMTLATFNSSDEFDAWLQGIDQALVNAALSEFLTASIQVIDAALLVFICALPEGKSWTTAYLTWPTVCRPASGTQETRRARDLEGGSRIVPFAIFEVTAVTLVDQSELVDRVAAAVRDDLSGKRGSSALKAASGLFQLTLADSVFASLVPTPAPTPEPRDVTNSPQTAAPLTFIPFTFKPLPVYSPEDLSVAPLECACTPATGLVFLVSVPVALALAFGT
ncbi:hypothetical protein DIPPA_09971 [Diplonema papillatum]|nr:hypothetical protein DIPPA_09971 [Diplonema papillatum]